MAVSPEVRDHLDRNNLNLRETFVDWTQREAADERTDALFAYFEQANLGDTEQVGSSSVVTSRTRADKDAPHILVVGSHDASELAHVAERTASLPVDDLRGAGTASLLGATMAFVEGFKATVMSPGDEPLNMHAVSVGPDDTTSEVIAELGLTKLDALVMTNAVNWSPEHPTVTAGSRGLLEVDLTVSAEQQLHDRAYAGASLNPLNRLVDVVASLRGDGGRIALPDFYQRADRPDRGLYDELCDDWLEGLSGARPSGSLPSLDRATQWPVVSVLGFETDTDAGATPRSATARVAIYLVPNQRPVEVERSLRKWFLNQLPESLAGTVRIGRAARPYRSAGDPMFDAQQKALRRVHGRTPLVIAGGGAIGAGELHYQTAAPILFAGLCGPHQRWGSTDEALTPELFELGVNVAAETCRELGKRPPTRSSS